MPAVATMMEEQYTGFIPLTSLEDAVTCIAWDNEFSFYAGSADGDVQHLSSDGSDLVRWKGHEGGVVRICKNPSTDIVATAGEDGRVVFWDSQANIIAELADEPVWIEQLAWNASGEILAASAGKTMFLWRGTESIGAWYDARRHVLAMDWAPKTDKLATASNKGLYLWRMGNDEPVQLLNFPGAAVSVKWKPDGMALAVGTQDGFIQIWRQDSKGKSSQLTMSGYLGKVNCLSWHPRYDRVATAGGNDVVIWDMKGKGQKKAMPIAYHQTAVTALQYSPNGRYLASGDRSGLISLWDNKGEQVYMFHTAAEITALEWNATGDALVAGDVAGRLYGYQGVDR